MKSLLKLSAITALMALVALPAPAAEPTAPNTWTKLDKAVIEGRRWDVPVGYSPELKRFLVLGGRISFADAKKPRSYDVLALDTKEGRWENWFPAGKDWGPKLRSLPAAGLEGRVLALPGHRRQRPAQLDRLRHLLARPEVRLRPRHQERSSSTPAAARSATTRPSDAGPTCAPTTDPEKELGGILLWSSMCYDRHNKQFVLFGGGNIQSERGDPGTWTYTPASNTWTQLKLDAQPPQRANSRLVLRSGQQEGRPLRRRPARPAARRHLDLRRRRPRNGSRRSPAARPSPRAGHALLWLPKAKKVLLLGGYSYTSATGYVESLYRRLPLEAWTYDAAADRWDLVQRFETARTSPRDRRTSSSAPPWTRTTTSSCSAATAPGCAGSMRASRTPTARPSMASPPGTVERRTGPHDPAWYQEGVPRRRPGQGRGRPERLCPPTSGCCGRRRSCRGRTWTGARPSSRRSST